MVAGEAVELVGIDAHRTEVVGTAVTLAWLRVEGREAGELGEQLG